MQRMLQEHYYAAFTKTETYLALASEVWFGSRSLLNLSTLFRSSIGADRVYVCTSCPLTRLALGPPLQVRSS